MPPIPRWLPNLVSALRIALLPVWVWFAEAAEAASGASSLAAARVGALAVLVAIGVSDVIDGWLARTFGLQTRTGAILDAVADKLTQVVLVTWFGLRDPTAFEPMPLWFLLLLVARDLLLLLGWAVLRKRARVDHRWHGKAASVLLFGALLVWTTGARVSPVWLVPIAALVVWSTIDYARRARAAR